MDFVTEWRPIQTITVHHNHVESTGLMKMLSEYQLRHWLAVVGFAFLLLSPVAGIASEAITAVFLASLGILMVSVATLLVPELPEASDDANQYEQDRRPS